MLDIKDAREMRRGLVVDTIQGLVVDIKDAREMRQGLVLDTRQGLVVDIKDARETIQAGVKSSHVCLAVFCCRTTRALLPCPSADWPRGTRSETTTVSAETESEVRVNL